MSADHLKVEIVEPSGEANGQTILFIHGWWSGAWVWEPWMQFFSERGYRCVAPTLRGHPELTPVSKMGKVSIYDHIIDLEDYVKREGIKPIVVGHSAGGLIGPKLAESIDIKALVCLVPGPPKGIGALASSEVFFTSLRYAPSMLMGRPFLLTEKEMFALNLNCLDSEQQKFVYSKMVPTPGKQAAEGALFGVPIDESKIGCPVFVSCGLEDRLTPPHVSRAIAKKYSAEIHEYPGHGHYPIREPGWEEIAGDVVKWLEKVCI